jgi:hypothetical protein
MSSQREAAEAANRVRERVGGAMKWRVGRTLGRTVYMGDRVVGMMDALQRILRERMAHACLFLGMLGMAVMVGLYDDHLCDVAGETRRGRALYNAARSR